MCSSGVVVAADRLMMCCIMLLTVFVCFCALLFVFVRANYLLRMQAKRKERTDKDLKYKKLKRSNQFEEAQKLEQQLEAIKAELDEETEGMEAQAKGEQPGILWIIVTVVAGSVCFALHVSSLGQITASPLRARAPARPTPWHTTTILTYI